MIILARTFVLVTVSSIMLSSCGLISGDEERIERAAEQMAAGEYRAAMIDLKNVLGGGSDSVDARLMLAEVSLGLGDPLSAEKELAKAVELGADDATVVALHFKILAGKGDYTGVLAALGIDSYGLSENEKLLIRGEALTGLGNFETATATFRDLLELDPNSPAAKTGLADAHAIGGDLVAAQELLEEVLTQQPTNAAAWHSLAVVRFRLGSYELAEVAFEEAVNALQAQANVRRYAAILAGLTETQLVLDDRDAARRSLSRLAGIAPNNPPTLFLAARLARADGDFALAARDLQTLLNVSPDNAQAQLFLANIQMMQGSFAQAETLLNRVVAISPGNLQARKLLAQVQLRRAQPGGAVEALAPLLESGVADADLYTILGQANIQQGLSGEAIEKFEKAADLLPDDVEAKLNLASAYFFAEDVASAIEILRGVPAGAGANLRRERLLMLALVADERISEADTIADSLLASSIAPELAATVVADHYLRTERGERARTVLRELVVAHPDMGSAKTALGRIELQDGNTSVARTLFESVVEKDPGNLPAVMGLARVAQLSGGGEQVIDLLEPLAKANPRALGPRVMLALEYLKAGLVHEAENRANEMVAIGFDHARISEVVAGVFAEVGRTDDALLHFQDAVRLDPDRASTQLGIARAFLALGRTVDARAALERALKISPGWPPAMTILALIEIGQGQVDDAMRLVREFQQLHPDNPSAFVLEGEVLYYQRDYSSAAAAFAEAVNRGAGRAALLRGFQANVGGGTPAPERSLQAWLVEHEQDTLTRKFLAEHYQNNNRGSDAVLEYEKILDQSPDDVTVLNNLAWQYQQQGDLQRALDLAKRAYASDPESGSIADTLGWIYYDLGELKNSVEMLSKASRLSPDNGEIQFHYAVVLSDSGEKSSAKRILQELIAKNVQFRSRKRADELLRTL